MLSGQAQGWRLGWGVLASRGMAAWITAQHQIPVAPQQNTGQQNPGQPSTQNLAAATGQAAELVRVLAGMTLACLRLGDDRLTNVEGEECEHGRRHRGGQGHSRAPAA